MPMRYLVTGAAGFIGAQVSRLLIEEGHQVVGVDNLNTAYDVRLKEYRLARLKQLAQFEFHLADVADRLAMQDLFTSYRPFDAVIHLAARAGVRASTQDPWEFERSNSAGTLTLLEMCRQHECLKFVFASTSSIYGENPPYPTPEEADSSHPLQPYAATKKAGEVMCHAYHHLYGLDVTIFRFFTVYGPAGRPDLAMFRFVQWIAEGRPVRINGDGTQSRGFTYIDDVARGVLLGLKPLGFEIINLGGHESISVLDLVKLIEDLLGKKARLEFLPFHPADMMKNLADVHKAKQLLGWQPQVNLQQGVQNLVNWYLQEREWASQIITDG
ncbi:MAG: NAD-dependent epimerase/dehydratase family protein [Bellilinea sp.]|nr:NAD-dependent epimerase/dehydratase family protein [Bellilinea sp.]